MRCITPQRDASGANEPSIYADEGHLNSSSDVVCRGGSRSRDWRGPYGERGAQAYNGGLGAVPPAGSMGRAPGQGVRGRSPPEAERFLVLSYV